MFLKIVDKIPCFKVEFFLYLRHYGRSCNHWYGVRFRPRQYAGTPLEQPAGR